MILQLGYDIKYDEKANMLPYNFFMVDKINKDKIINNELLQLLNKSFFLYLPLMKTVFSEQRVKYVLENLKFEDGVFCSVSDNKINEYDGEYIKGFKKNKVYFHSISNIYNSLPENDIIRKQTLTSLINICNNWEVEKIIEYIFKNNKNIQKDTRQLFLFVKLFEDYNTILKDYVLDYFNKFYSNFNKNFPYDNMECQIISLLLSLLVIDEERVFLRALKNRMFAFNFFCENKKFDGVFYNYNMFFSIDGYLTVLSIYANMYLVMDTESTHHIMQYMKVKIYNIAFNFNNPMRIINLAVDKSAFTKLINDSYFLKKYDEPSLKMLKKLYENFNELEFNNYFSKKFLTQDAQEKLVLNALKLFKPIFTDIEMEKMFVKKLKAKSVSSEQLERVLNDYVFTFEKNYKYCLKLLERKKNNA
jgi:hypothetical protein